MMKNNQLDLSLTISLALLSLMMSQQQDEMTTVPSLCPAKANAVQ